MSAASLPDEGPVTVIVTRRVRRGREQEYEAWLKGILGAARAFPGFLGVNVIRPSGGADCEYVTILRFDSQAHLKAWEDSPERRAWFEKMHDCIVESEPRTQRMTGLEFWFTAPQATTLSQPARYKMVIVLVIVLFCMLNTLAPLYAGLLADLHPLLRSFVIIVTQVILMTYVIMPLVLRVLSRWLFDNAQ
jgi:antibiotic biosynthesis monooxygenase (ABM) superfamily enzyme